MAAFLGQVTTRPLVAYAVKHNVASRRVLEKCGFVMTREDDEMMRLELRA